MHNYQKLFIILDKVYKEGCSNIIKYRGSIFRGRGRGVSCPLNLYFQKNKTKKACKKEEILQSKLTNQKNCSVMLFFSGNGRISPPSKQNIWSRYVAFFVLFVQFHHSVQCHSDMDQVDFLARIQILDMA